MKYEMAREYISQIGKKGSILGLESMECLMKQLEDVQDALSIIHVAGTNGKGSVSSYIASVLQEAGYKVGRYASPAVFEYLEIISINGKSISEEQYGVYMDRIQEAVDFMIDAGNQEPTAFEVETALAFLYFYNEKCDYVILETGMGGRLDATNIIKHPLCSVITSISMDHMAVLGDSLEAIAGEKAGIIKKRCPVIIGKQEPEVERVLQKKAWELEADLYVARGTMAVEYDETGTHLTYQSISGKLYEDLHTGMLGTFQVENLILAVEVLEYLNGYRLKDKSFNNSYDASCEKYIQDCKKYIQDEVLFSGIANAFWKGRFQKVCNEPKMYIDGGHNPAAAKRLKETLEIYFTNSKIIFIMGVLKDKAYREILEILAPMAKTIITITPDNPRGLSGEALKEAALGYHSDVRYCDTIQKALRKGKELAGSEDVILAFGSLSFLEQVVREL